MTRIESELHDLYECLMRNDDMADRDTYNTIVGIANDVAEVEAENAKLREYVKWLEELALRDPNYHRELEFEFKMKRRELGIEVGE